MITKGTSRKEILKLASDCKKCGHCCSYSSGIFLDEDIRRISKHLGMNEDDFREKCLEEVEMFGTLVHKAKLSKGTKPFGPCSFLKKRECSIHEVKPLNCLLGSGCHEHGEDMAIWFMLNFLVDPANPESVRQYAQYLKTHRTIRGGKLDELVPDRERLSKMLDYTYLKSLEEQDGTKD